MGRTRMLRGRRGGTDQRDGKLDEVRLVKIIAAKVEEGINGDDGDVTQVRQNALAEYRGEEYGDERSGYSKVVTREVLEAVEWGLPALMRVFMGGAKAVTFRPSGPDDERQAEHETDAVNYWFYDGNEEFTGFMTLYTWLKDMLLNPNGYVTVLLREEEDADSQTFSGLQRPQADALKTTVLANDQDAEVEISKSDQPGFFDVTVNRTVRVQKIEVAPAAPETCIVQHGHNKVDVDSARFSCLREQVTRSELIEMGYSAATLDAVGRDYALSSDELITRMCYVEENPDTTSENSLPSEDLFWRHECFMNIDWDEDGIAERRRIVMVGDQILENEPDDYCPIVAASSIVMGHKHVGMSYAELVSDLQRITTTLVRQLLDNIYRQNVRRTYVNERALLPDNSTMDQMLDGSSEVIEIRGSPHESVMPEVTQPIIGDIAQVLAMFAEKPQLRTGVAPQLTLDPNVLKESTMGAFVGAMEQASQRLELLARLFAETGLKKVFQKIHHLLRNHFTGKQQVKINERWVEVNPSSWKKRSNMGVKVGIGFANNQALVALLTTILQIQREAMPAGLADQRKIFATLTRLIEAANMGHAGTYFNDPNEQGWKPPEPQPDAQMIVAQAQAKSLAADAKRRDAELKHKIEMDKAKLAADREAAEAKGAELINRAMELEDQHELHVSEIALRDAQITELNARAAKHSMEPAESSSDDEFARAEERTSTEGDSHDTDDDNDNGNADKPGRDAGESEGAGDQF
ncbi:MAG: hypothetical protein P8Y47_08370 [Alphaproteobacteria bacterium]